MLVRVKLFAAILAGVLFYLAALAIAHRVSILGMAVVMLAIAMAL